MRRLLVFSLHVLMFIGAVPCSLLSQEVSPEAQLPREVFFAESSLYSVLYSGRVPEEYYAHAGTFYIDSRQFVPCALMYNNKYYGIVHLNINAHKDQLLVLLPNNRMRVVLNPLLVNYFILNDEKFIYHSGDTLSGLAKGYYAVLHDGDVKILRHVKKEPKEVEDPARSVVYMEFFPAVTFHAIKNGVVYHVSGKRRFIKIFSDHKKELKALIRKEHLDFKLFPERAYSVCASFYESLIQQGEDI